LSGAPNPADLPGLSRPFERPSGMTMRQQALFWLGVLAVIFLTLYLLSPVLLPFVLGIILAYLLNPLVSRLERIRVRRTVGALVVSGAIILVFALALSFVVPFLANEISDLIASLPDVIRSLQQFAAEQGAPIIERIGGPDAVGEVQRAIADMVRSAGGWLNEILASIWSGGEAVMNAFMLVIVTPIIAFYLLIDWPRMTRTIDSWLPRRHDDTVRRLWREMDHSIAGFLRGQTVVVIMLAAFYAIALSLIGLNWALVIGIGAGLLSFVPLVGAVTGFMVSGAVATVQFWPEWWMIGLTLGVFVFGQIVEGYVIAPKIVGEATGVHPVWLMFALFAFGYLFGFVGLLLAVPLAAIIAVLCRFAIERYMDSSLYLEMELPEEDETYP
jgi:predicted PurR-regulated permease PerM